MSYEKTALVTGCNRGIGQNILKKLLSKNIKVICCVKKLDKNFKKFIKSLKNKKGIIKILEFDLSDSNKIKKEIYNLYKDNLVLDILINNAGIASGSIFEMTSMNKLKETFEINFFSQLLIIQLLIKLLKKSKSASIINIGSISGLQSERGTLSYATSKSALMHATKILAKELSIYNIRVNSVAPNIVKTDMLKKMDKKILKKMLTQTPHNKPLSVNDVSKIVMYLASEKSSKLNGKILKI